jgi:predicted ArsR family transcriptional regulator
MPRHTDNFTAGLETILNNNDASFMKKPQVFKEITEKANMNVSAMLRHIGKRKKANYRNEPTDEERGEERLHKLEEASKQ